MEVSTKALLIEMGLMVGADTQMDMATAMQAGGRMTSFKETQEYIQMAKWSNKDGLKKAS